MIQPDNAAIIGAFMSKNRYIAVFIAKRISITIFGQPWECQFIFCAKGGGKVPAEC